MYEEEYQRIKSIIHSTPWRIECKAGFWLIRTVSKSRFRGYREPGRDFFGVSDGESNVAATDGLAKAYRRKGIFDSFS